MKYNNTPKTERQTEILKSIMEAHRAMFEGEYYNEKLDPRTKKLSNRYVGRQVTWYGDKNQMIVIHKDYVDGMWGNIYDHEKMQSLVEMINEADENVEIECSYGMGNVIDILDIKEQQESHSREAFRDEYDGLNKPASIGDDDLDKYIGSEYLDDLDSVVYDLSQYAPYKFKLAELDKTELSDDDIQKFRKYLIDQIGEEDIDEGELEEFINLEKELYDAIQSQDGDLGTFRVQLRDGHHRVFAAIESGENYVCLNLNKDDLPLIEGHRYVNRVTQSGE